MPPGPPPTTSTFLLSALRAMISPCCIGGIGVIKEDGTFTLETFVEGVPQDGTFVGEHKIVVYNQLPSAGAAAGPLTTPFAYSTGDTTPLKMVIEKDKPLEIVLEVDDDTMTEEEIAKYLTDLEANQSSATQAGMAAPRDPLANQNNGGEGETGDGGDDGDGSEENEEDGGSN